MQTNEPKLPVQQFIILSICRFAEPIVFTSILPYLPEMIEYVGVPKNDVGRWVGITSAVSAGCQGCTAIFWGTVSDYTGRKPIILLGLASTMIFSLVFGFSQTLTILILSRAMIGLMSGNVGIMRTVVAEMVPETQLQPLAFSILPIIYTTGSTFGPALGGALAHPAENFPNVFGGSELLKKYPFALPNLVATWFFVTGLLSGFLFLRETLETKKSKRDCGLVLGHMLTRSYSRRMKSAARSQHSETTPLLNGQHQTDELAPGRDRQKTTARRPSWNQVLSPQSSLLLVAYGILGMQSMAFDSLLPVFLHRPIQQLHNNPAVQLPFKFIGGFGMDSQKIGLLCTLTGVLSMLTQFIAFPWAAKRYGTLNCIKFASIIFPVLYLLVPFTALVPEPLRSIAVCIVIFFRQVAGSFAITSCTILLNNSATSPIILGALNGIGTSVTALGRALGPAIVGYVFTLGVEKGYIIFPWWTVAFLGVVGAIPIFWTIESNGSQHTAEEESS